MARFFLLASAISGFLSVALGAFAAHGLKEKFDAYSMGVFRTGVDYQFYHTFALAIVGLLLLQRDIPMVRNSGIAFIVGIFIFSGSLYLLAFTGIKMLGAITPIGGLAFMIGWILLGIGSFRALS